MNVILFTMEVPLYVPRYIESILGANGDVISSVVLTSSPDGGFVSKIRDRYRMFGPAPFAWYGVTYARGRVLDALPDSLSSLVSTGPHSVQSVANKYDVPVRQITDINSPEFVEDIHRMDPDLLLSVSCGQRFETALLEAGECINIHGSLLPKYRGRATAFWVLYHNEEESGVTAHRMTEKFDAGAILKQRRFPIDPDDTMHDVYEKIVEVGPAVVNDVIDALEDGQLEPRPVNAEEGRYYSLPGPEDRRQFLQRGNEFR